LRYLTAITNTVRNFDFYSERAVNSFKTAFACLLGLAIIKYLKIPSGQWIVITIIVIMSTQTRLGGALQRSYARTIGTLCGAIIGVLTVALFDGSFLASSIVIFFSVLMFSYIATSPGYISNAGTIGGTTLALLLINQEPGFSYPIERIVEITVGIVLALLVSISVFPIHASKILFYNFASSCKKLAAFYQTSLCSYEPRKDAELDDNLISEDDIVKLFPTQRQLIKETATEQRRSKQKTIIFNNIIHCEREIFHAILLMSHSIQESPEAHHLIRQIEPLNTFHHDVMQQLHQLTELFKRQPSTCDLTALTASLNKVEAAINTISLHQTLQVMINVHSYLFCAKVIVKKIQELVELATQATTF
jgi:uncharacterized membrane protein YccC